MNLLEMKRQAVPLHAEVAAMLRNQIMSGQLAPGSQLPPLSELTEKLGVARMTVKQAMDSLVDEGLIERHSGRGTFVKEIELPERQVLKMRAEMAEIHSMVAQMEVSVVVDDSSSEIFDENGVSYRSMKRIHTRNGKPFCCVDLRLESAEYEKAPDRFESEIVVSVLKDLGIKVASARQRVTISYADFETAQALDISVNSPVFHVFREFFSSDGRLIYSAILIYPGDGLEFDIEFSVGSGKKS